MFTRLLVCCLPQVSFHAQYWIYVMCDRWCVRIVSCRCDVYRELCVCEKLGVYSVLPVRPVRCVQCVYER